jgi:hypothetical protein
MATQGGMKGESQVFLHKSWQYTILWVESWPHWGINDVTRWADFEGQLRKIHAAEISKASPAFHL